MKHKKISLVLVMAFLLIFQVKAIDPKTVKPVKNIILMVSDGTSLSNLSLARWLQYYQDPSKPKLFLDPYLCGTVRTNCSDGPIGDSAPTTSCYVTGHASRAGYVSSYPPDQGEANIDPIDGTKAYGPMATLLEAAKQVYGKSTGFVVTCEFPHATPADVSAHYYNRGAYNFISEQQVHNQLDVVIGGGNNYLSRDQEAYLKEHGYAVLRNDLAGMRSCKNNKMWALYNTASMQYEIDRDPSKEPELAEGVKIALEKLSKNSKGFFLLVEGSKVDWATHANDPATVGPEVLAFDRAVGAAIDFAKKDGNTVVIALADHCTGGMSIGKYGLSNYSKRTKTELFQPILNFKMSIDALGNRLNAEPYEKLREVFKECEGIDLTDEEVELIVNSKGYKSSPIPVELRKGQEDKPLYSPSFSGLLAKILNNHCCLGWSSSGHTGDDVFLACYHPKGQIPVGMNTNVEIAHYMQALFGMYGKMDAFSDRIFTHHDVAFKGYEYKIIEPEDKNGFYKLVVNNSANGKTMTIQAHSNIAQMSGTDNRKLELPSVMPYVDRTKKFYVPSDIAKYLK